jgi:hypothetical protein
VATQKQSLYSTFDDARMLTTFSDRWSTLWLMTDVLLRAPKMCIQLLVRCQYKYNCKAMNKHSSGSVLKGIVSTYGWQVGPHRPSRG